MATRVVSGILALGLASAPLAVSAHSSAEILANDTRAHAEFAVTSAAGEFVLVVAPNLVDYASANAAALAETARYCQSIGKAAPAAFGQVERYSDYVLDAWEFSGTCE